MYHKISDAVKLWLNKISINLLNLRLSDNYLR